MSKHKWKKSGWKTFGIKFLNPNTRWWHFYQTCIHWIINSFFFNGGWRSGENKVRPSGRRIARHGRITSALSRVFPRVFFFFLAPLPYTQFPFLLLWQAQQFVYFYRGHLSLAFSSLFLARYFSPIPCFVNHVTNPAKKKIIKHVIKFSRCTTSAQIWRDVVAFVRTVSLLSISLSTETRCAESVTVCITRAPIIKGTRRRPHHLPVQRQVCKVIYASSIITRNMLMWKDIPVRKKKERGGNSTASHPETAQTLARVFITVAQLVSYSQLLCCWPLSASVPQLPRRCWVPLSLETDIVSRAKTTVDEKGNKFVFLFNRKKKKDNTQRVSLSFFLIINGWHVASSKRNRFSPSVRLLSLPRKFRLLENTETVWPNLPVAIMAEN